MKIIFGCDHAGLDKKQDVFEVLESLHCEYEDMGVYTKEKNDIESNKLSYFLRSGHLKERLNGNNSLTFLIDT